MTLRLLVAVVHQLTCCTAQQALLYVCRKSKREFVCALPWPVALAMLTDLTRKSAASF